MTGSARDYDDVGSSAAYAVAWTTVPAAYNILASDPLKAQNIGFPGGRPCRAIVTGGAGTLVVTRLDGSSVTLPSVAAGHKWEIQASALAASSTATNVVVLW